VAVVAVMIAQRIGWPMRGFVILLLVGGLLACATAPLPQPETEVLLTPRQVVAEGPPATEQIWGGVIAEMRHRNDRAVLEVVGYPLRNQEPLTGGRSEGRFRLEIDAFLEPMDYRPGRRITAVGRIDRIETGRIDDTEYAFPVMAAREVHLWPEVPVVEYRAPRVTFGIGIGIGR
jgi:outer membrane lipoprotein